MVEQVSEQARAAMSQQRGKDAARIKDPEKRRAFVAEQGKQEAAGKDFSKIKNETDAYETGGSRAVSSTAEPRMKMVCTNCIKEKRSWQQNTAHKNDIRFKEQ